MSSILAIQDRTYVFGIRGCDGHNQVGKRAHLYTGTFQNPDLPMCRYGWTDGYDKDGRARGYSIFRGNHGELGFCKICMKRARRGLAGIRA